VQTSQDIDTQYPDTAKHGKRLSLQDQALILQLSEAGKLGTQIAQIMGVDNATVSRTLKRFGDTRVLARKRLENGALKLTETLLKTTDGGTALKALGKLDVVRDDAERASAQVMVMIGDSTRPLAPPDITITPISPPAVSNRAEDVSIDQQNVDR